jgi:hypothetical protein
MRVRILFLVILHGLLVVGCAQQVKMSKSVQPQATETESSREKKPHPEAVGLTQTPISGGQKIDPMTKDSFGSLDSIGLQNDKVPPVSAKINPGLQRVSKIKMKRKRHRHKKVN